MIHLVFSDCARSSTRFCRRSGASCGAWWPRPGHGLRRSVATPNRPRHGVEPDVGTDRNLRENCEKLWKNWWKLVKTGEHMVKTKENSGILDGIWPWFIYSSCISMDFEVLIYRFDMVLKWIYVNDIWIYQFVATFGKTGWRNKLRGQK